MSPLISTDADRLMDGKEGVKCEIRGERAHDKIEVLGGVRLRDLSARAKNEKLSPADAELLEYYLQVGRLLDLMRSKAQRSLQSPA